jgi:hypothetical protein
VCRVCVEREVVLCERRERREGERVMTFSRANCTLSIVYRRERICRFV